MKRVLIGVAAFCVAVVVWVVWMDRDLVEAERRTADSLLLLGSTLVGMVIASMLFNLVLAPAIRTIKEDPKGARTRLFAGLAVFVGANAGLPWAIRWAWPYRTGLMIVVIAFFLLLAGVVALVLAARKRFKT